MFPHYKTTPKSLDPSYKIDLHFEIVFEKKEKLSRRKITQENLVGLILERLEMKNKMSFTRIIMVSRALDKREYLMIIFLISHQNHIL